MRRKTLALIGLVMLATITVGAYHSRHSGAIVAPVTTLVTRGEIVSAVAATGTLSAVTTVEVGSEVTGTIEWLGADFNSLVHKGEVLARLDPSTYQTTLDQAKAALASAQADAQRYLVAQAGTDVTLTRARELHDRQLMTDEDFQAAQTDSQSASAQVASADAAIRQAQAAVQTAELNLSKTVIDSPIDGVVISRSVDVGQTVSANMSAPTLFVLAADLSKMEVDASIDESDVGRVRQNERVTFHVDAYPNQTFEGKVLQVRLNPTVDSNVVSYTAVVDAPNSSLELKPGMTATLSIIVDRRDDVLLVPMSALQFQPTADVLARFGAKDATTPPGKSNTVWVSDDGKIAPAAVTTGLNNGIYAEIVSAPFGEGASVVTRMATPKP